MFQYAFGYALAKKYNTDLKIDTTLLMDRSRPHEIVTHRTLLLNEVFDLEVNYATEREIVYFNGKSYPNLLGKVYNKILLLLRKNRLWIETQKSFTPMFLNTGRDACFVGSFQSEKYFIENQNEIRKLYTFKNPLLELSHELAIKIVNTESIAIHVRRGDYVSSPVYSMVMENLTFKYYEQAIEIMKSKVDNPTFFVFSDDLDWCKKEFKSVNTSLIFVEDEHSGNHAANYLQLISLCKHFIISNSTYAWWGAYLSSHKSKVIIAPDRWFKKEEFNINDIVPNNWLKI